MTDHDQDQPPGFYIASLNPRTDVITIEPTRYPNLNAAKAILASRQPSPAIIVEIEDIKDRGDGAE